MKTIKLSDRIKIEAILMTILLIFIALFCRSQKVQYRSKVRPDVQMKLDSLYPYAKGGILDQSTIHDTIQIIRFNCNCSETEGMILLVFDTNGNILTKEVHHNNLRGLPDTLINYIRKNKTGSDGGFANDYYIKRINSKGVISYGIMTFKGTYMYWFKGSGEFISKEAIPPIGG